jgi:hypothetical protein
VNEAIRIKEKSIEQSSVGVPLALKGGTHDAYGICQLASHHARTHQAKKGLDEQSRFLVMVVTGATRQ